MKSLIVLFWLGITTTAIAQQTEKPAYTHLSKSINDDGKMVTFDIQGEQESGQKLRYKRTFNVANFSAEQREALTNRVLDSLGVNDAPKSPESPQTGTEIVTFECKTCTGKSRLEVQGNNVTLAREFDSKKADEPAFPFTLNITPGTYQYTYWQNKVQQMKLTFTVKAGEANVVNVK